MTIAET